MGKEDRKPLGQWYNGSETKIDRPVVLVVENRPGRFTFEVSHANWQRVYTFARWTNSQALAEETASKFLAYFDAEATKIEQGGPKRFILGEMVDNGIFTSRSKLSDAAKAFAVG